MSVRRSDAPSQPKAQPRAHQKAERLPSPDATTWPARAIAVILLAGAALVPIWCSPSSYDPFRLPKQLAMYTVVIAALSVASIALLLGRLRITPPVRNRLRVPVALAGAGLLWTAVTTVTSTNVALSVQAVTWGAAVVAAFLLAAYSMRSMPADAMAVALFVPGVINATILLLQATGKWNPWYFPENTPPRLMKTALLGNADDAGVYLAAAAVAAMAFVIHCRRFRALYIVLAVYLAAALFATETLTAVAAYIAATTVALIMKKPRVAWFLPVLIVLVLVLGPTQERVLSIVQLARRGSFGIVVSGRLVPFAAAGQMFLDRPVVGVGPGCYKFHYMSHYVETRNRLPRFFVAARTHAVNFGEVHNDHLQVLAEMGFPAYLMIVGGITAVGLASRRKTGGERGALARTIAAPFAVMALVAMLAFFPLQIAATAYTYAIVGGACLAWTTNDEDDPA